MFARIHKSMWITLDKKVRDHLATVFDIPMSGACEIMNNTVVSDGRTEQDLEEITKDRMVMYVGSNEEFARLWELTVKKANYELNPPPILIVSKPLSLPEDSFSIKLELPIEAKPLITPVFKVEGSEPYCDTCPSTKGRHRKLCPKFK